MYDRRAASGTSGLTKSSNGYEILTSRFENETEYKTQGLFQYTM
jgi:chromodomain-helicase-DNA-binding protein 7